MNGAQTVARLAGAAIATIAAIALSSVPAQAAPARAAAAKPISKVLGVRLPGAKAGVCTLPAPNLVVTPSPVSFPPTLRETTSAPIPFAIQNTGTGTLVVSAITVSNPPCDCPNLFDVIDTNGCVGAAIPPGGSCLVDATFYAYGGTGQTWGGTIDIASNDPGNPISSWPVEGTIGASLLTVSASLLDFGSTTTVPPAPLSLPLGVANAGSLPLTVNGVSIFGTGSSAFTAVPGANCAPYGATFPLTLPVGAACDLTVTFTPLSIGLYPNVSLYVNFTDGSTNDSEWVRLMGAGIGSGGALAFTPSSVNFGYVPVGQVSSSQVVTATNLDTVPLVLSNFVAPPPYVADFSDCIAASPLPPQASCEVTVHVDPGEFGAGTYNESLEISANLVPAFLPVSVTLTPNLSFNPSSHDFGDVPVGSTPNQSFVLENLDPVPYSISVSTLSSAFTQTGGTCLGGTVPASPGAGVPGTCTVDVQFAPSGGGYASDYFYIVEPASNTYAYVDLYGNGIVPGARLQFTPDTVSFPPGLKDTPAQVPVVVTNAGDAPTPTGLAILSDNAEVTVDPGTCAVQVGAGASCTFTVHYSRASVFLDPWNLAFLTVQGTEGQPTQYGNLYVYGNTVASTPAAIEAAPSGTVAFPPTVVGSASVPLEISLGNTGGGTATLDITSIDSSSPEFVLTTDCPMAVPLSGQACCLVSVTFQPAAPGLRNATLTVSTTAGILEISLVGQGVATLPPDVALGFAPPSVAVGAPSTLTVTVSNLNDFPLTDLGFANTFPPGLQVAPIPAVANTCGGTVTAAPGATSLVLSGGTVPAGLGIPTARAKATTASTCSVSVAVIGTQPGALVNTLPAGGVTSVETIAAGVSTLAASGTLTVGGATPLPTAITFTPGTVAPNAASTFDLNVGNPNLGAFASPAFTYALPAGVVVANPANGAVTGGSCAGSVSATPGAGSFSVTALTIPTGGACDVQVDVTSPTPGSYPATIAADTILGTVFSAPVGNAAPAIAPVTLTVTTAPAGVLTLVPPPPGPLDFGSSTVGTPSAPQVVTVSNTGNAPLAFSGPFALAGDFSQSSTTCGASLPAPPNPLSACTATLVFTPAATGTRNGTFSVVSSAGNAVLNLTGQGTAVPVPAISLSTSALFFPGQTVGTTSSPQPVTVSNAGTAPLAISGVAASGDFAAASDCTSLSPLAPLATCGITVTFTPILPGMRTGSLAIASNDPGTPSATVVLEGDGVAAASPNATLSPATLAFPSTAAGQVSAPLSATLSNSGSAPLAILAVEVVGAGFTMTHNCGPSLAMGASCTITAIFAPPSAGSFAADVRIMTNSPAGAAFLRLTGSATAAPVGRLAAIPSTLSFGDQIVGTTSATRPFTVTNVGSAVASVSRITTTGDFSVTGACADVRPGESCAFLASFSPTAVGTRSGQVLFEVDGATAPFAVSLSGNGVPVPAPRVQLSASSLAFGNALSGVGSTLSVTVTNVGSADLVFGPLMEATGDFRVTANGCTGTLAPAQSCRIDVGFLPSIPGARSGELRFSTNAEGSPHRVALAGNGCRFEVTGRSAALVCGR
jgi:hypothetical protein